MEARRTRRASETHSLHRDHEQILKLGLVEKSCSSSSAHFSHHIGLQGDTDLYLKRQPISKSPLFSIEYRKACREAYSSAREGPAEFRAPKAEDGVKCRGFCLARSEGVTSAVTLTSGSLAS